MKKRFINQNGSSMVEMLGVLAIVGVLTVGVVKVISGVYGAFSKNVIVNEARDLQKLLSERYKFDGNYDDLFKNGRDCSSDNGADEVANYICENKLAPFQMCSNGKLYHRGGGAVKICRFEVEEGNYDNTKYVMVFYDLSKAACRALAQINWYTKQKSDVYQMVIVGANEKTTVVDSDYSKREDTTHTFPLDSTTILNACNAGNENRVQFVFF